MPIDPIEFGRVLGRLDSQDAQLKSLEAELRSANSNISTLLAMANQGKGSLATLLCIGSIIGSIIGWIIGHWWK